MDGHRASSALLIFLALAGIAGCGSKGGDSGAGSGGGGATAAPTVTISVSPGTITLGQSAMVTIVTTNATTCSASGTLQAQGQGAVQCDITLNSTVVPTSTGTLSETVTVTGPGGTASASASLTVNPVPVTVTSVSVSAAPSSITTVQTATCTATVQGTGAYGSGVSWSATNGTITAGGLLTPSGVGTATCTANSTQVGYTNVSGSAMVTVTVPPPTITSVTVSCTPVSITTAQTAQCGATVAGTGAFSSGVTWSATGGTVSGAGLFTPSGAGTATVTAKSTQSGYTNVSGAGTVTVVALPPAITVNCVPSAITTALTSQCTATYQNLSSGVVWSGSGTAAGGSVTAAGVFSSTAAGTFTVTATSTQPGDGNISGSAVVTVTTAVPVVTSMDVPLSWYCDVKCGIAIFHIFGSGFAPGTTITGSPNAGVSLVSIDNAGQLTVSTNIGNGYQTGKQAFTVCSPDGLHCSSISIALIGNQNTIVVGPDGEVYLEDQAHGTIWKYKRDGTPDGSIVLGISNGIAIDDQTQYLLLTQNSGNDALYIVGNAPSIGNGSIGMGVSARNGVGCITQPVTVNLISCVNIPQVNLSNPTFNSVAVGSQPWSLWMGLFGTETDAFVYTRDGSPTLFKCNTFGGNANPSCSLSFSLPGVTPFANLAALAGGWQVTGFDKGPAAGTIASLSTADNLLFRVNASSMQLIGSSIVLPAVSTRAVADQTHGTIIVASVNTTNMTTTFTAVNATTGLTSTLTSTASFVVSGLGVSLDGTMIYAAQGNTLVALPNQ